VTFHFAPKAEADFAAVVGYLAERNPVAAAEFADRIFAIIDRLAASEFEGPEQTLISGEVVRSWPIPPVRVYYQRQADAFWVLRIYHQSQTPIVR
jgi:plasmid stabilization system protein ParE